MTQLAEAERWAAECGAAYTAAPDDAELRQWWLDALADLRRTRAAIHTALDALAPAPTT
jgi:hypothetical protein